MRIYLSHPIMHNDFAGTFDYYDKVSRQLAWAGYEILNPMTGKDALREDGVCQRGVRDLPMCQDRAILGRDHWMTQRADVVYCNLIGADKVSIGCAIEVGWAYAYRPHTILAMEQGNLHDHPMLMSAVDVRFETHEAAVDYLLNLIRQIERPLNGAAGSSHYLGGDGCLH